MDISCSDNRCLICNSTLIISDTSTVKFKVCINDCMRIIIGTNNEVIQCYIYEEKFKQSQEQEIEENINYWKKNDRFLMKILGGNQVDL